MNGTLKPIPTYYGNCLFRSRLEAKWAVFLDACGADWEYETEGYTCSDGTRYMPDFLVHNVITSEQESRWLAPCDVFIEAKGVMNRSDAIKMLSFCNSTTEYRENKLLVVGSLPNGKGIQEIKDDITKQRNDSVHYEIPLFGFDQIDGSSRPAIPCMTKNRKFAIYGLDWGNLGLYNMDIELTERAYQLAKFAKFEYGETPDPCAVRQFAQEG